MCTLTSRKHGGMDAKKLLRLVRYHWALILICAQIGVALGAALVLLTPREYTASSDVFVQVTGGSSTSDVAAATNFSQQQARNFSTVATREVVLSPVIDKLKLDTSVARLRDQITTTVPLNSTMITIAATSDTPQDAAAIANAVATELTTIVPDLTPKVFGESPVRLQVIEDAVPPARPSSPNIPLYLFLGLLAGLVLASVAVVVRSMVGTKVHSVAQAKEITSASLLGAVVYDKSAASEPIPLFSDSWSLRAEEYRQLRANLRFLQPGEDHKVFVVTSSIPREGKTTTSANIAVSLAAAGLHVGLLEADLRRPTLPDTLDLSDAIGLTDVLAGDATIDECLQSWGPDRLEVMVAGDPPPNPSELLESTRAGEVFRELRNRFDVLIIDSPPLTAVSDSAVIARQFGGAVLVVGSRRVRVRELQRAVDLLRGVGATIEGVVVNFAAVPRGGRYEYGYAARDAKNPQSPADSAEGRPTGERPAPPAALDMNARRSVSRHREGSPDQDARVSSIDDAHSPSHDAGWADDTDAAANSR